MLNVFKITYTERAGLHKWNLPTKKAEKQRRNITQIINYHMVFKKMRGGGGGKRKNSKKTLSMLLKKTHKHNLTKAGSIHM